MNSEFTVYLMKMREKASIPQLMLNSSVRCWSFLPYLHQITYFLTVPFNPRPRDKDGSRIFGDWKSLYIQGCKKRSQNLSNPKNPASIYAYRFHMSSMFLFFFNTCCPRGNIKVVIKWKCTTCLKWKFVHHRILYYF